VTGGEFSLVCLGGWEEMITEKPSWIRHEGLQIFSIDIQPGGLRFATGGGDQKVCCVVFSLFSSV